MVLNTRSRYARNGIIKTFVSKASCNTLHKMQKTIDARSYSHQALEEIRISSVRRVETGESPEQGCQGYGSGQTRTQSKRLTRYASAAKATQHCG